VEDSRGKASAHTSNVVIQVMPDGDYHTVTPCRLLDTRTQEGGSAPVASGTDRVLDVVAVTRCGISPLARAVAINITVAQPTSQGRVTVYPANLSQAPGTSTLNFRGGATLANNALVMLSSDGRLKLRPVLSDGGSTHLIVDVVGFFVDPQ
jgi:hypothetical protein